VKSIAGVKSAAITSFVPLSLNYSGSYVFVEGQPAERGANVPLTMVGSTGVGYFETMGIPLVEGRDFNEHDTAKSTRVVIVNEAVARQFFPGPDHESSAIGKRISFAGSQGPFREIVGVAKDGKYFNIGEDPRSFVYSPIMQDYNSSGTLIVRTEGDPSPMIAAVRNEVRNLDPNLPIFDVKSIDEHMSLSLFPPRIAAGILGGFGALALILAGIGVYGVTAYSVAQRTRDIGIRMALGARSGQVLRLVLSEGFRLAGVGVLIGLGVAFALTGFAQSVLYGVSATDPATFLGISLLLAAVSLAACLVPARRASRVDPIRALRTE
jgi:predicted permease